MRAVGIVAAGVLLVPWLIGCGEEVSPEDQAAAFMKHVSAESGPEGASDAGASGYAEVGERGMAKGGGGGTGSGRGAGGGGGPAGGGTGFGRPHRRLPNRWRPMDINGDGQLDRATEYVGVAEEFDRVDADGDGRLMPTELRPATPLHTALGANFAHVDADGDGQITEDEWNGAFDAFDGDSNGELVPEELRAGANKELAGVVLGWFSHFDREPEGANDMVGDLKITRAEWSTCFAELDRIDPDGRLVRAEVLAGVGLRRELGTGTRSRPFRDFPPRFQEMDADQNQSVSAEEFQGGDEEFARLDLDGDGQLTVREVRYSVPTVFVLIYHMDAMDADASGSISVEEWQQVLTTLDSGGDGGIDREELRALASGEGKEGPKQLARMILAHFTHFDRDKDATITNREWQKQFIILDQAEPRGQLTAEELRGGVRRHALLEAQRRRGAN
jgi:Ca2+-binding EF-hand superfamily protein